MKTIFILVLFVISASLIIGFYHFKPLPQREKPMVPLPTVATVLLEEIDEKVYLESFGTVIPEKELTVVAEVEGTIEQKNSELIPGGILHMGDLIAQLDKTNYELVVRDRQAAVVEAENNLALEIGQQVIAKQEYDLFKDQLVANEQGRHLVLREPQLKRAQASLDAARARLDEAYLDVERTSIRVPFNAMILESFIEEGQFVASHAPIARMVATDRFWVILSIPISSLSYIDIPTTGFKGGSSVLLTLNGANGSPYQRRGYVIRLLGEISPENRMSRIVVAIDDPLDLNNRNPGHFSKVLLGSYVQAEINCGTLRDVFRIPRSALHDSNTVWLFESNKLKIATVDIVWSRKDDVLVRGPIQGKRLITSRIQNPLPGMSLSDGTNLGGTNVSQTE